MGSKNCWFGMEKYLNILWTDNVFICNCGVILGWNALQSAAAQAAETDSGGDYNVGLIVGIVGAVVVLLVLLGVMGVLIYNHITKDIETPPGQSTAGCSWRCI
ncbi:unnamed protein product [Cuscuta epithymum]|uniref:Uncharacterized protein n=1 Tax=Cuscuta epithymum TaxID=186058 RepID=A0AAV0E7I9_9ASTE|nr:unnamed protein product [Cuscuta epithymum]